MSEVDEPTPFDETTEPPTFEAPPPEARSTPAGHAGGAPSRGTAPAPAPSARGPGAALARPPTAQGPQGRNAPPPSTRSSLPAVTAAPPRSGLGSAVIARSSHAPPASVRGGGSAAALAGRPATGRAEGDIETLASDEFTQLDQPAPADLKPARPALAPQVSTIGDARVHPAADEAGESTHLDTPLSEVMRPSGSVQVEGVVGERLPAVVVRRAPPASTSPAPEARLLANAPIAHGTRPQPADSRGAELTQIHAAAALGIAPEPAPPPSGAPPAALAGPPEAEDKTPPPALARVDFGPLKLAEKEEVLARYPVEVPGLGAAERLGERAPAIAAVSKLLPVVFTAMIALSFVGVFLVGPLGDMLQAGDRQSAREAIRAATAQQAQAAAHDLPTGSIRVVTQPTKAAIEVDGYYLGRSPIMIAPPEERPLYVFRVSAEGHKTWEGELRAEGGGYVIESSDGRGAVTPDGAHHRLTIALEAATP